jgi:polysaccharide biosynthesis PFTS motif protein
MKISDEIHQLIFKRLIFLNPTVYKKHFQIEAGVLFPKIPLPQKSEIAFQVKLKKIIILFLMMILYSLQVVRIYGEKKERLTLIYSLTSEQIFRKNRIEELLIFFSQERFGLEASRKILVESKKLVYNRRLGKLTVTFDISLRLFMDYTNFQDKIKILKNITCKFLFVVLNLRKNNHLVLASKEFVFDETVIGVLSSSLKIDKVITTISNLSYQPYIFEARISKGKRFMLWYSVNSIPVEYKKPQGAIWAFDTDVYKFMKVDCHWVWNQNHKTYLSTLTNSRIEVKGSMVFYPNNMLEGRKNYDIVVFDVTPTTGVISNNSIYHFDLLSKFILDIVEVSQAVSVLSNKPLKVSLKPKRVNNKHHDARYLLLLNKLKHKQEIEILDPDCNLYDVITSSKLIISYPFTAPAVIGKELIVPSIYYLPEEILLSGKKVHELPFLQNKKALKIYVSKVFK